MTDNNDGRDEILAYIAQYGIDRKDTPRKDSRKNRKSSTRHKRTSRVTLDLHGLHADEAERKLRSVMHRCRETGAGELLVIHGYGLHSNPSEGPVLRKLVIDMLDNDLQSLYRYYRAAPFKDGGDGATVVIFR